MIDYVELYRARAMAHRAFDARSVRELVALYADRVQCMREDLERAREARARRTR